MFKMTFITVFLAYSFASPVAHAGALAAKDVKGVIQKTKAQVYNPAEKDDSSGDDTANLVTQDTSQRVGRLSRKRLGDGRITIEKKLSGIDLRGMGSGNGTNCNGCAIPAGEGMTLPGGKH